MSEPVYYKVLGEDGVCCHGGAGRWKVDGSWMPTVHGGLSPCVRGYHLCRGVDLVDWLGPVIWIAEGQGKSFTDTRFQIFQEARVIRRLEAWTPVVARGFAVECASRALPILQAVLPGDERAVEALVKTRHVIYGTGSTADMMASAAGAWEVARMVNGAARDAAMAAYGAAVWESDGLAAWAAVGSARAAIAAAAAERSLADSKAQGVHPRDAERQAGIASSQAMGTEKAWQTGRLQELLGEELVV
ncbi:MAG: hypothetical protein H7834_14000 [Magnetococcus sp. YQC-9]